MNLMSCFHDTRSIFVELTHRQVVPLRDWCWKVEVHILRLDAAQSERLCEII